MVPDKIHWKEAMEREISSFQENDVWDLVDRPKGGNIVQCKWVFKLKRNGEGEVDKFKARLVAKGFSQRYGVDYLDTFAPVVRHDTLRLCFSIAVAHGLHVHHLDVSTAFLNGSLSEDIFMYQPEGFVSDASKVYKLKKAIYGLKQASRSWYERMDEVVLSVGFKKSQHEPCVYFWRDGASMVIICVYVDDFFVFFNDEVQAEKLKQKLHSCFKVKDLGSVVDCLGMRVEMGNGKVKLNQKQVILNLLNKVGMAECKSVSTPMVPGTRLTKGESITCDSVPYQQVIGSLLYLSVCTRPDISYATNYLSQFNNCYASEHWQCVKRVLRYLKGTIDAGIEFRRTENNPDVCGFVDASFANDVNRKSVTGYVFVSAGGPICWESKKQSVTALSSTEAEYIAIDSAGRKATYLKGLLSELCGRKGPILLWNDNQSALKLASDNGLHARTQHIEVKFHHIRELVKHKKVVLNYMESEKMIADVFTKALNVTAHRKCIIPLGMVNCKNAM